MRILATIAIGGFAAACLGLGAVDLSVWVRTGHLRRGTVDAPRRPDSSDPSLIVRRTGSATYLASGAGLFAVLGGVGLLASGAVLGGGLVAPGLLVATTGLWARVVSVEVGPDRLEVRHAIRGPTFVAWTEGSVSLSPPRAPTGGWRLRVDPSPGARGGRTILMPSDLLGNEAVVQEIVGRAGLRWDGHRWARPPRAGVSGNDARRADQPTLDQALHRVRP